LIKEAGRTALSPEGTVSAVQELAHDQLNEAAQRLDISFAEARTMLEQFGPGALGLAPLPDTAGAASEVSTPREEDHASARISDGLLNPVPQAAGEPSAAGTDSNQATRQGQDPSLNTTTGRRELFPPTWFPKRSPFESVKPFGHTDVDIRAIEVRALECISNNGSRSEAIRRMDPQHVAVVFAYTEELGPNAAREPLYLRLNRSCRSLTDAEKANLGRYRDFLHHMTAAVSALPNFSGLVYRGINVRISVELYSVGRTITWHQFSSTSKLQEAAATFLDNAGGGRQSGTMFVLHVSSGKEIELISSHEDEEEVLLLPNTFFRVEEHVTQAAEKRRRLRELDAIMDLSHVSVFVLRQL